MTDTETETIYNVVRNLFASMTRPSSPPDIEVRGGEFIVQVDPEDQGRVVGKHGRTIWAISSVVLMASLRVTGKQSRVTLLDPKRRSGGIQLPFKANPEWNKAIVDILMEAFEKCFLGMSWSVRHLDATHSVIDIRPVMIDDEISRSVDIREAIHVITRSAGMANGAVLTVNIL